MILPKLFFACGGAFMCDRVKFIELNGVEKQYFKLTDEEILFAVNDGYKIKRN